MDIFFFLSIFVVFLFAYGTAAQALLYPNETLSLELLQKVIYLPYFQMYGELSLDEFNGEKWVFVAVKGEKYVLTYKCIL